MDTAAAEMRRKYAPGATAGAAEYRSTLPGKAYEPRVTVTKSEEIYRRYGKYSYFQDLYRAKETSDRDAIERLHRNNSLSLERDKSAGELRAISTTNSQGGEFVPPLWIESEFVRLARPRRVTADLMQNEVLPGGTDVINIPKVNTGSAVGAQSAQNSAITEQDLTTTSVSSPVVTIAGGQTVSLQLLEQSPISVDKLILEDLAADYSTKLDGQVLSGSGTGGNLTGLLTMPGTTQVSYSQATPALAGPGGLYSAVAESIASIHSARFAPADCIIMHPRRWAWALAQVDNENRPLMIPQGSVVNAMGISTEIVAQGSAGTMLGLPVFLDAVMPTNSGGGTNQDSIIVARAEDLVLWESAIRAEAFQQTYASNMSVFCRLYAYSAFIGSRYPQSIAVITGVGLKTPTW